MRIRKLHLINLGREVQVMDLSSDSEDEAAARSPDHKRRTQQAAPYPDRRGGCSGTEAHATSMSLHQSREAVKKGKQQVIEGGSAWAAGPPKLGGGSPVARECLMEIDGDPWSAHVGQAGDAGNRGAGCWVDWGDQMQSEKEVFQGSNGQQGQPHNVWDDGWKGILGAKPADPDKASMSSQGSQAARDVSGCDDTTMEDSSWSWLSRVKGLNFPIDEHHLRTKQIESDEKFARELQEQFDQELQGSQHSETADTAIALTLHEQDAERARIAAREGQSSSSQSQRDRSMAHLYSFGHHAPAQSSPSLANRTPYPMSGRRGFGMSSDSPEMQQVNMLISQLTSRERMDLPQKWAILDSIREAVESFGDPYSTDTDDEYENMIVHDVNNSHKGASDDQINNLPTSVVEVDNSDDPCPICWDCPAAGDSLRHLPCLHKFHKKCVDKWLRIKISCPVCKSNII